MKTLPLLTTAMCAILINVSLAYGEDKTQAGSPQAAAPTPEAAVKAGPQQMFQPLSVDPALVRQSMQARSEYDDLNRRIMARQTKLYEENARIKELQIQLRDLQAKIDKLMAQDEELSTLKKNYAAITSENPMGSRRAFGTNTTPFAPSR